MVAVLTTLLLCMAALTVDLGSAMVTRREIQKRTDAAALAGGYGDNLPRPATTSDLRVRRPSGSGRRARRRRREVLRHPLDQLDRHRRRPARLQHRQRRGALRHVRLHLRQLDRDRADLRQEQAHGHLPEEARGLRVRRGDRLQRRRRRRFGHGPDRVAGAEHAAPLRVRRLRLRRPRRSPSPTTGTPRPTCCSPTTGTPTRSTQLLVTNPATPNGQTPQVPLDVGAASDSLVINGQQLRAASPRSASSSPARPAPGPSPGRRSTTPTMINGSGNKITIPTCRRR